MRVTGLTPKPEPTETIVAGVYDNQHRSLFAQHI